LATPPIQRVPVSGASQSPAIAILQRLPFSSAYHSPAITILQHLPFSSYFVSSHFLSPDTSFHAYSQPFFRLCPTEAIIVKKPASIISDAVRAVDSGLINTSQKEGWTRRRGMDLIYPDLSLLGICSYILVYSSYLTYVACSSYLKVDG
jgi:hypothetical protein